MRLDPSRNVLTLTNAITFDNPNQQIPIVSSLLDIYICSRHNETGYIKASEDGLIIDLRGSGFEVPEVVGGLLMVSYIFNSCT